MSVNPENYVTIQGWMLSELGLKGTELWVYAIIYGFTQEEGQYFTGSLRYMSEWTGKTKQTVLSAIQKLINRGLLEKKEIIKNGVKFCEYHANNLTGIQKNRTPIKKTLPGDVQKTLIPGQKIRPNNIEDNISEEKIEDTIDTYTPPRERVPYQQVADLFNTICTSFPSVQVLNDSRKRTIKARFQTYGIEDFKRLFRKAQGSAFLRGEGGKGWQATFDWLIKDGNMAKVLEGQYDDRKAAGAEDDRYTSGLQEWVESGCPGMEEI